MLMSYYLLLLTLLFVESHGMNIYHKENTLPKQKTSGKLFQLSGIFRFLGLNKVGIQKNLTATDATTDKTNSKKSWFSYFFGHKGKKPANISPIFVNETKSVPSQSWFSNIFRSALNLFGRKNVLTSNQSSVLNFTTKRSFLYHIKHKIHSISETVSNISDKIPISRQRLYAAVKSTFPDFLYKSIKSYVNLHVKEHEGSKINIVLEQLPDLAQSFFTWYCDTTSMDGIQTKKDLETEAIEHIKDYVQNISSTAPDTSSFVGFLAGLPTELPDSDNSEDVDKTEDKEGGQKSASQLKVETLALAFPLWAMVVIPVLFALFLMVVLAFIWILIRGRKKRQQRVPLSEFEE
ncbi:hypothetical protein HZS_4709 [Henneguya salminicola]|nr:hypothetical protein HZS_4709 [Henneguya salminicola]